jgi:hypothetical protein
MQQTYQTDAGPVIFVDTNEMVYSSYCQPRDIVIVRGPDGNRVKAEIAVDIRRSQGHPEIGIAKNLKFA